MLSLPMSGIEWSHPWIQENSQISPTPPSQMWENRSLRVRLQLEDTNQMLSEGYRENEVLHIAS